MFILTKLIQNTEISYGIEETCVFLGVFSTKNAVENKIFEEREEYYTQINGSEYSENRIQHVCNDKIISYDFHEVELDKPEEIELQCCWYIE